MFLILSLLTCSPLHAQDAPAREEQIEDLKKNLDTALENPEKIIEQAADEGAIIALERDAMLEVAVADDAPAKKNEPPDFLKPLINRELSFIKRACNPTDEQMQAIVAAATKAYRATGDMIVENQQFFNGGPLRVMGPNNEQLSENPLSRVRRDAREYLQPLVSPQQYTLYKTEVYMRDNFERRAAIATVVGIIDEKIALTDEQRTQLIDRLMQKWTDVDLQAIQNYLYNPGYVPQLPPDTIEKVITPRQLKSWQSFQQVNFGMNFSFGEEELALSGEDWIK